MREERVFCVEFFEDADGTDCTGIKSIGTIDSGPIDREAAYELIKQGNHRFYVENGDPPVRAYLETATTEGGTNYVRTKADATEDNNLLSLRRCQEVLEEWLVELAKSPGPGKSR